VDSVDKYLLPIYAGFSRRKRPYVPVTTLQGQARLVEKKRNKSLARKGLIFGNLYFGVSQTCPPYMGVQILGDHRKLEQVFHRQSHLSTVSCYLSTLCACSVAVSACMVAPHMALKYYPLVPPAVQLWANCKPKAGCSRSPARWRRRSRPAGSRSRPGNDPVPAVLSSGHSIAVGSSPPSMAWKHFS